MPWSHETAGRSGGSGWLRGDSSVGLPGCEKNPGHRRWSGGIARRAKKEARPGGRAEEEGALSLGVSDQAAPGGLAAGSVAFLAGSTVAGFSASGSSFVAFLNSLID